MMIINDVIRGADQVRGESRGGNSKVWKAGIEVDTKFDIESNGTVVNVGWVSDPNRPGRSLAVIQVDYVDHYGTDVEGGWWTTDDFWQMDEF